MAFMTADHGRKLFVVLCKKCQRDIPAGVTDAPKWYVSVTCPLCREKGLYLPTEVGFGFPHYEYLKMSRTGWKPWEK